jgi:XTP/dITP diphosphohydrolase
MTQKILVATTNQGKVKELKTLLETKAILLSLSDVAEVPEVEEDADTFAGNARKKAWAYAQATGLWTTSDDSGLVIDALGGRPGVNSARFSGARDVNRSVVDQKNIQKVLELMHEVPSTERTARFKCCLCLAAADRILLETEGSVEGLITTESIGEGGFGYDPIFFLPDLAKTMAQLTMTEKNAISHRGHAIRQLKPLLETLLHSI